jgi:lipoprotein
MKPFKTLCVVLLAAMLVLTTAACGSKGKTNDNLQTGGSASQKQDKKNDCLFRRLSGIYVS